MDTVYFDWSQRRGVMTLVNDSNDYRIYPSLLAMADDLKEPHRIIGEATFDSFNLDARKEFIERCIREGHELLTVPTRETTRWRYRLGFGEKPSSQTYAIDLQDVQCIRAEAKSGAHLKKPGTPDPELVCKREAANRELMRLRSTGEMKKRPRSEGFTFISHKEIFSRETTEALPPFGSLTRVQQTALGDSAGKNYNPTLVAAVGVAAKYADNTKEFDYLAGTYAHGKGSQIRSDVMFWGWTGGGKRQKLNKETRKRDDLTLSEYRRELRWLYHQLRKIVT